MVLRMLKPGFSPYTLYKYYYTSTTFKGELLCGLNQLQQKCVLGLKLQCT